MAVYPLLVHVTACLWYYYFWPNFLFIYKDSSNWHPKFQKIQELGPRYLTNWNLVLQTLFFVGCLFHDAMKLLNGANWLNLGSKFQNLLSIFFSSIVLPTGIFVSVTFWVMYAYDREIVYPEIIDSYIPFWQNHGMHTTILVLILFEFFTTRHKFPPVSTAFVVYLGFTLCYAFVFLETYFEKGRWVYPLFGMYNIFITLILIIVLFLKLIFCLFVGIFIQNVYWGKEEKKRYRKPDMKSN